ncbi:MAG: ABC transporter ATP-binding protein [Clostridia bacterium]|nr:ABC transporter ATP-binding protein [Clostridia bacterium]
MSKKNKKETKDKKDNKKSMSLSQIVRYNLWALGVIHRAAPGRIAYEVFCNTFWGLLNFLLDSWLLRYVLNSFQEGSASLGAMIIVVVGMYGGYYLIDMLKDAVAYFILPKWNLKVSTKIQKELFEKSLAADLDCYERPEFYDKYVKAMDEAAGRVFAVLSSVGDMVWTGVNFLSNGALLAIIDPLLMIFSIFPILFGLLRKKELAVYHKYVADQKPIDRRKNYIRRTFYLNEYAKEMRLSHMEDSQIAHFRSLYGQYKKVLRKHGFKRTLLGFIGEFSGEAISTVGSAVYAVFQTVVTGNMMVGDCAVSINAISQLGWILNQSVTDVTAFSEHALFIKDMKDFLEYEPTIKEDDTLPAAKPGTIRFENVSFSYTGSDLQVLNNVSFSISKGERVALVGCNGAGKSTIVKLLLRLYEPTEGRITLDGVDIRELRLSSYRDLFSVLFQDYKCFSMSVVENVMRRKVTQEDATNAREALKNSGVLEKIDSLPKGIDTTLTRYFDPEGAVLSGGESQKVQLAAVFASGAPMAILDEPSSALDPIAEYKIFESMIKATEEKGVLFISHRLSSAVLADKILVMEKGVLAEQGTHEQLLERHGVYADLFNKQAENYFDSEKGGEANG